MEIVLIVVFFGLLCWALCAVTPRDPKEDEEQAEYLQERKRNGRGKQR